MADDQEAAPEVVTIGDFVRLIQGLWVDPGAVVGGRVVSLVAVGLGAHEVGGDPFIAQLLLLEVGWIIVATGSEDECDVLLREALLIIYNNRG